jgi:hypothetical protein
MYAGGRKRWQTAGAEAAFCEVGNSLGVGEGADREARKLGAKGRDRTADTSIFSAVLYQLSYLGAGQNITSVS